MVIQTEIQRVSKFDGVELLKNSCTFWYIETDVDCD